VVIKQYPDADTRRLKVLGSGARNEQFVPDALRDLVPALVWYRRTVDGERVGLERREGARVAEPELSLARARAAGRTLGRIHAVQGPAPGSLDGAIAYRDQREAFTARWRHAVALVAEDDPGFAASLDAWAARLLPAIEHSPCRLVHGDFGLASLLFRDGDDEVAAVLDWEHARYGDPAEDWARIVLGVRFPEPTGFGDRPSVLAELRRGWHETCGPVAVASRPVWRLYALYHGAVLGAFR
jgi:aminoglycoside phosphotransferase (APT) family kinase protein